MSPNLVALLYLVAGVLFILALRGLSSPETSRRGNYLGMAGMAIAVITTLAVAQPQQPLTWAMIVGGIALGGGIGAVIATYHILLEWFPDLSSGACDPDNPCTLVWFRVFGVFSLPTLALTAFLLILTLVTFRRRA